MSGTVVVEEVRFPLMAEEDGCDGKRPNFDKVFVLA